MVNNDRQQILFRSACSGSRFRFFVGRAAEMTWQFAIMCFLSTFAFEIVCAQEGGSDWSNRLQTVVNGTQSESMKAIGELNLMVSQDQASGLSDEIGKKIFLRAKKEVRPGLIQQYTEFVVRMPRNVLIVQLAKEDLRNPGNLTDYQTLMALSYVLRHEKSEFLRYFDGVEYARLPKLIKTMFDSEEAVKTKRTKYVSACVDSLLAPTNKTSLMDQESTHRKLLLDEQVGVLEYFMNHDKEYRETGVPLALVYLMGEIASSSLFDLLVHEYKRNANDRVAISLGACAGSLQIKIIKDELSEKQMASFLSVILKEKIEPSATSINDAVERWRAKYLEVKQQCIQRSKPQVG